MTGIDVGHLIGNLLIPIPGVPQPGDWVAVLGQVRPERPSSGRDDEDVRIEMFSHGAQYAIDVRKDRVRRIKPPPELAERCPHLGEFLLDDDGEYLLKRCSSHRGHNGPHTCRVKGQARTWLDKLTAGYFEER